MLQVSNNFLHKLRVTKKELCLIRKTHSLVKCYSSNMWLGFSNTGLNFWFPLKNSKSQPIDRLSV